MPPIGLQCFLSLKKISLMLVMEGIFDICTYMKVIEIHEFRLIFVILMAYFLDSFARDGNKLQSPKNLYYDFVKNILHEQNHSSTHIIAPNLHTSNGKQNVWCKLTNNFLKIFV